PGPRAPGPRTPSRWIASTRVDDSPSFSRDGRRIAFSSDRSGSNQIWICDAECGTATQLTDLEHGGAFTPSWSPDGRRIAFAVYQNNLPDIFVVEVETGRVRKLTNGLAYYAFPDWSPDGKWIYFDIENEHILRIPAEGGEATQVTTDIAMDAKSSHDGRYLYHLRSGETGIWRVSGEGGPSTRIVDQGTWGHWGVYDRGLCYITTKEAPRAIECLDFQTKRVDRLTTIERNITQGFAVSPDGEWVLYSQEDLGGSDLVLVENFR
ncbi:MAG: TolB family protein, partial [Vicinamibacteria bacterium]